MLKLTQLLHPETESPLQVVWGGHFWLQADWLPFTVRSSVSNLVVLNFPNAEIDAFNTVSRVGVTPKHKIIFVSTS